MAIKATHKEQTFGVGDAVRVWQKVKEGDKFRLQAFEGMVIGIKGRGTGKSFTVRRVGAAQVGIEKIFPIESPVIDKIEVVRKGTAGVTRSKLYYTRHKAKKEIEEIYSRSVRRTRASDKE